VRDFFRRYGWLYIPGLIFLGLSSFAQTRVPLLLGQIIDQLDSLASSDVPVDIIPGLLLLLLAAVAVFVTRFIWRYLIMGNSRYLENCLRTELFNHLLRLPVEFYQQQKTGDLMAYAINDIGAVRQTFGPGLALSANALVMSFLAISSMTDSIDPRLTLFALLPVPLILVLVLLLGRQVQHRFRKVQEVFSAVSDRVQESISGIQVIKAHSQESEEAGRFEALNQRSRDAQMRMTAVSAATGPVVSLLFGISFSIGLIYGSQLVIAGTISVGDFVAFNGFLALIVHPVQSVARIINMLQRGNASWKRLQKILKTEPSVADRAGTLPDTQLPARSAGFISVRNLTFTYPGATRPVLSDISFELRPGRKVGILGRTGSGKSTLANLLVRLYNPPYGSITLDGLDISQLPLHWLRSQIAVAPQDNFLFSTTLAENIRFFDPEPTASQVEEAARLADLHQTVSEFTKGYETLVGERGITLSGGQKQRVGLARAIIKNAPVLIIDDTLSAVDVETEQKILSGFQEALRDKATLIIANRISALQDCDEILVLSEGQIIERGTHSELINADGFYADVAARQAAGSEGGAG